MALPSKVHQYIHTCMLLEPRKAASDGMHVHACNVDVELTHVHTRRKSDTLVLLLRFKPA